MVLKLELLNGETGYNSEEYDGYIFFQEMAWEKPTTPGFGRGLLTSIPDLGYSGWFCSYDGDDAKQPYQCKSVYVPDENIGGSAPDFLWDEYDIERGFQCGVKTDADENFDVAKCLMFMPKDAASYGAGIYRWSPFNRENVKLGGGYTQFGIVANGTPSENKYVNLGKV